MSQMNHQSPIEGKLAYYLNGVLVGTTVVKINTTGKDTLMNVFFGVLHDVPLSPDQDYLRDPNYETCPATPYTS